LEIFALSWILFLGWNCKPFQHILYSKPSFTDKNQKFAKNLLLFWLARSEVPPFTQACEVMSVHFLGMRKQITTDRIKQKK